MKNGIILGALSASVFSLAVLGTTVLPANAQMAKMGRNNRAKMVRVTKADWGKLKDGRAVDLYTLHNRNGMVAKISNLGGIVVSLKAPDKRGEFADIVMGLDTPQQYIDKSPYFGALIGRFGNRIAKGRFVLDGKTYTLATNNGPNHLHGGKIGFDKKIWLARPISKPGAAALELVTYSGNGDEGYPGNLRVKVIYSLTDDNELRLDYSAVTDAPTVINLTHHTYFNLYGAGLGDVLNHRMMINANRFTPTDATAIPTGELRSVRGTPFNFLTPHAIGERINGTDQQLIWGTGYDHNFVLNKKRKGALTLAARASEPRSGRVMTVYTTEPGIQLYTGNFLDGIPGKYGRIYNKRGAFCLETQNFPDAPNHANFPSSVLRPGNVYRQTTIYRFSTQ